MAVVTRIEAARFERTLWTAHELLQHAYQTLLDLSSAALDHRIGTEALAEQMGALSRIVAHEYAEIERAWASIKPYASAEENAAIEHVLSRIRGDSRAMFTVGEAIRTAEP